jgi:hypothetical protein
LVIPAGLHGRAKLGYFAPLGNLYFNEIYHASGMRDIAVDYGPDGRYRFGSPSFYNPTFWPFSRWTTDRTGVAAIDIDLTQGRAPWIAERRRVARNLGTNAHLIDSCNDIEAEWLKGVKTIALTAGASAPEHLVEETVTFLRNKGFDNMQELEVMPENVRFGLPPEIVEAIAAAPANATAD